MVGGQIESFLQCQRYALKLEVEKVIWRSIEGYQRDGGRATRGSRALPCAVYFTSTVTRIHGWMQHSK
jgi:hypothetical protein